MESGHASAQLPSSERGRKKISSRGGQLSPRPAAAAPRSPTAHAPPQPRKPAQRGRTPRVGTILGRVRGPSRARSPESKARSRLRRGPFLLFGGRRSVSLVVAQLRVCASAPRRAPERFLARSRAAVQSHHPSSHQQVVRGLASVDVTA